MSFPKISITGIRLLLQEQRFNTASYGSVQCTIQGGESVRLPNCCERVFEMHRVGIIPFDTKDDLIALLFVTSQTRGRWILPKGRQKSGETHSETCHREGFEEAGVRGTVLEDFPITFPITKQADKGVLKLPVTYYPYFVTEQVDEWPERKKRQRHWALLEDAPKVAYREDLLGVIQHFGTLRQWITESAERYKSTQQAPQMQAQ